MRHHFNKTLWSIIIAAFTVIGAAYLRANTPLLINDDDSNLGMRPQVNAKNVKKQALKGPDTRMRIRFLPTDTPLLVYDFNLGMQPAQNVVHLNMLGFSGVVTTVRTDQDLDNLVAYTSHASNFNGFRVLAYVVYDFSDPSHSDVWINALPVLELADAPLWVIVRNAPSDSAVRELLLQMAQQSQAHGIRTVIYPHWHTNIETAAEASALIDAIGHPNLWNSLHTCHEIRGGNQYDLIGVATDYTHESALVTIAGAEENAYAGPYIPGITWADAIMPLDEGDFSLLPFLQALHDAGYDGPVILHTFGIENNPGHLWRSIREYDKYRENIM